MKKIIILFCLLLCNVQIALSQQKMKGYQVIINDFGKKVLNTTYTRTLLSDESGYKTLYKVYNLKNELVVIIEADHNPNEKEVIVEVKNPNGGVFTRVNTEKGNYETASLKPFGNMGNYRLLGGNDFPPQLSLQFLSEKYENVKVISVNATRPSSQTFVFYVFSKELSDVKEEDILLNTKSLDTGTTKNSSSQANFLPLKRFKNLVKPKDDGQISGKVVVQIFFNSDGVITDAVSGVKGTTVDNVDLLKKCKDAMMNSSLIPFSSASYVQTGFVVFNFKIM